MFSCLFNANKLKKTFTVNLIVYKIIISNFFKHFQISRHYKIPRKGRLKLIIRDFWLFACSPKFIKNF